MGKQTEVTLSVVLDLSSVCSLVWAKLHEMVNRIMRLICRSLVILSVKVTMFKWCFKGQSDYFYTTLDATT